MSDRREPLRDVLRAAEALARSIGRDAVLRLLRAAVRRIEPEEVPVAYVSEADAWDEAERLSGRRKQ